MPQDLWKTQRRIEKTYAWSIMRLIQRRADILGAATSPGDYIRLLRDYALSKTFREDAYGLAGKMVTHIFHDGEKSWRAAARKGGRGREIYEMLHRELSGVVGIAYYEAVRSNAEYITTLPATLAKVSTGIAARAYEQGMRDDEIVNYMLASFPDITASRARLIARTELSKASTELTKARSEEIGLDWYVWRTANDGDRVRDSHRNMNDVLVCWRAPPNPEKLLGQKRDYGPYHAGEIFNCRCYAEPVVEFHYLKWPHKVHYQGRIQWMTLAQFKRIAA